MFLKGGCSEAGSHSRQAESTRCRVGGRQRKGGCELLTGEETRLLHPRGALCCSRGLGGTYLQTERGQGGQQSIRVPRDAHAEQARGRGEDRAIPLLCQ